MRHAGFALTTALAIVTLAVSTQAQAQAQARAEGGTRYKRPPAAITKILETPPTPSVTVDPTRRNLLLVERVSMPPVRDLARPMWRLAGLRLDPKTNGRAGSRRFVGLTLLRIADGTTQRVDVSDGANLGMPVWSPNGERFAFTNTTADTIELWVGDTKTGKTKRYLRGLNGATGRPFVWEPGGTMLICKIIPKDRGPAPIAGAAPAGPVVRETSGRKAPVRTYQDLLKSEHDEDRYEWIAASQLVMVHVDSDLVRPLGKAGIYARLDPRTTMWMLTARVVRPFSHLVTARSFPEVIEVRDAMGGDVFRRIASRPLRDQVPIGGVPIGPRSFAWHETTGELVWVEALDGGDPKRDANHRDRVMASVEPFDGEPREVFRTEHRFSGLMYLEEAGRAMIADYDRDRHWVRTWVIDTYGKSEPKLLFDRSARDRYGDPGLPVTRADRHGAQRVHMHDGAIFLTGRGATPKGDRPFLRRFDLETLKTTELWRCEGECYEEVVALLNDDSTKILTKHQSQTEPPNYYVRDLKAGTRRALTKFADPAPELRNIEKRLVTYERADGVPLSATLYVPPGRKKDERLPLIVWAYPREFTDRRTAGQVSGSPYRFTRIGGPSHLFFLLAGYAVMDRAAMPVIGDPETVNETFIEQIVAAGKAAVDKAAALGVADPTRVGVGGHSYGAFMTANLLAHCDHFKAGIARSGAYNRTLTPFGFQSERRTLWQAPDLYFKVSPFMHAHKLNEPILLVHGQIDNNSGTFPLQSERLFHALNGHGGTARLVMLPHESHGYRAAESVLHVVAEQLAWFDKYVKHAKPRG